MRNPDPQDLRRASGIFKVLSHPDRLRVACLLMTESPLTQKQLIEKLGWPQSTMARHVSALRRLGLITATRHGNEVLLEMGSPVAQHLMDAVCEWVHPETGEQFSGSFTTAAEGDR